MAVPKFYEFFASFLRAVQDGEMHSAKEVQKYVAKDMALSDSDLEEILPSGRQSTFTNRVNWARTYLNKAGLIETPLRARYRITQEGLKALSCGKTIDVDFLKQYPAFVAFQGAVAGMKSESTLVEQTADKLSPLEQLDAAYAVVNSSLASDLMDEIMKLSSAEFEHLVVKLLLQMGYGSGIDDAGIVTKPTGDGGIDGIIKEDQLGFSSIYIQAKQWGLEQKVSRPEVQKFAGALQGEKATKGLFITTTSFTSGAREYAENLHGSTIVLIDGGQMTRLMIKYNLGVSVEHTYEVKRIDSDFFSDIL